MSAITRLVVYAVSCAAVPMLRRSPGAPPAAFSLRAGTLIALAGLILCAWLVSNSSSAEARTVAIAALIGAGFWLGFGRRSGTR
jgi:hypothetical protein